MSDKLILSVKAARVNSGKTQNEVAKCIGLSLNTYKKKENGKTRFYVDEIVLLSRLFHVKMENFFEVSCHKKTQPL